jgi:nitric oxide reductase subunit B
MRVEMEMEQNSQASPLSPWWRHAVIIVMIFGFATLSILTVLTYTNAPPIPLKVVDEAGKVLFTKQNIDAGQEVFLKYGLMEHGTLWGHGAYLGPDYTADYLHREAEIVQNVIARKKFGSTYEEIAPEQKAVVSQELIKELKRNRYDASTGMLGVSLSS